MAFYSVHKSSMSLKLASNNVFWQSKVHFGYPIKGFFGSQRYTMGRVFSRSWHYCKLICKRHHPYTTLATGEWMIFWLSDDSPVEVGSTECNRHLEIRTSLHVRLLPATLHVGYLYCSLSLSYPLFPPLSLSLTLSPSVLSYIPPLFTSAALCLNRV